MAERPDAAELVRQGISAYLAGDDTAAGDILSDAYNAARERGETRLAAKAAFWVAFTLIGARELTRASGWISRARRLLEEEGLDCVECGYVMLPQGLDQVRSGDFQGAEATFGAAERIGERFGDPDLTSLARQARGRVLVGLGRVGEGVALFDEAMVSVTAGEVTPIVSGVVYCSVISACFEMFDVRRAQEWTEALSGWCARQQGRVAYHGDCLAYRAELFILRGRWSDAFDEARRAYDAIVLRGVGRGTAAYALAELHRLRGDIPAAEAAYRQASENGRQPLPGVALLRLAEHETVAARAAIERAMAEPLRGRQRAEVLAAAVEIFLAAGDVDAARRAAADLGRTASALESVCARAMAASADGAVRLAEGAAREALPCLREALAIWDDVGAPYEAARVRVLIGRACEALEDRDGARMEWTSAARVFRDVGSPRDLHETESLIGPPPHGAAGETGALTPREVEVVRLIAQGKTNREIGRELGISEKTVARHVSNIFIKLDLPSRAAATAYAFTHKLLA